MAQDPPATSSLPATPTLPDGLVAIVKRECPTCELVVPVLEELAKSETLTIYTQDDPTFPESLASEDDRDLSVSWHHRIEAVPTLLRIEDGKEQARAIGWHRGEWQELTGASAMGELSDWPSSSVSRLTPNVSTMRIERR